MSWKQSAGRRSREAVRCMPEELVGKQIGSCTLWALQARSEEQLKNSCRWLLFEQHLFVPQSMWHYSIAEDAFSASSQHSQSVMIKHESNTKHCFFWAWNPRSRHSTAHNLVAQCCPFALFGCTPLFAWTRLNFIDPAKDSMPRACCRGQGLPSDLPKDSLWLHLVVIDCMFVVRKVFGMTLPKTACQGHAVAS